MISDEVTFAFPLMSPIKFIQCILVLKLKEIDLNVLRTNIYESVWKRNETFYYLDYPNENNTGFECMTMKNSNDPRKPCRFPYIHHVDKKTSIRNNSYSFLYFLSQ